MFKVQQFTVPSSLTLHYHAGTGAPEKEMLTSERSVQREHSLSPDSLEQRLLKHHLMGDDVDDDESLLTSSSSLIDSISAEPPQSYPTSRSSNSTKTILKTLTSHGFLSFSNDHDDDLDDDLDEIHFDQDDVNLLFSDPEDGGPFRFANESIDIDDDYEDEQHDEFYAHIRPLPIVHLNDSSLASSIVFTDSQAQYSSYHLLDPISEAASEEERRAAISILRQQQQKHKHSTSSSLSISANDHCDGDTTINDDLSTLSGIDEQNTSMDDNSISQSSSLFHDQHIHKKRRHQHNRPIQWATKVGRKWTKYRSKRLTRSIDRKGRLLNG